MNLINYRISRMLGLMGLIAGSGLIFTLTFLKSEKLRSVRQTTGVETAPFSRHLNSPRDQQVEAVVELNMSESNLSGVFGENKRGDGGDSKSFINVEAMENILNDGVDDDMAQEVPTQLIRGKGAEETIADKLSKLNELEAVAAGDEAPPIELGDVYRLIQKNAATLEDLSLKMTHLENYLRGNVNNQTAVAEAGDRPAGNSTALSNLMQPPDILPGADDEMELSLSPQESSK